MPTLRPVSPFQLALVDPGRRQRRDAHAIANEDDDVSGQVLVGLAGEGGCQLLSPEVEPVVCI